MKKSERVLLALFVLVFIVIVGGGLLSYGINHYRGIVDETERLKERLIEMNMAITQGAEWQQRSEWLDAQVPSFASRQAASTRLLEVIQKEAEKAGVTLAGREFLEASPLLGEDGLPNPETTGFFDRASVRLTISAAKEKAFFAWMHAMQQPGSFLGVTRLQLIPSGQGKTINAEVDVTQFYQEQTAGAKGDAAE